MTILSFRFFSEKTVLFVQLFFTGVFTILLGFDKIPFVALFIFALAARSFIAGAFASTYVVTVSVYPTLLRFGIFHIFLNDYLIIIWIKIIGVQDLDCAVLLVNNYQNILI